MLRSVVIATVAWLALSQAERVLDLSHPYDMRTPSWVTDRRFEMRQRESFNGTYYLTEELHMATHTGTHMDAPCHFARGRWCITDIPLERLLNVPAVVIDVNRGENGEMTPEDLEKWEAEHGSIPKHAVIILRSGWASRYPNRREYFGSDVPNSTEGLRFPGFGPEAAKWIVERTEIAGLGIDTPSIDPGKAKTAPAHVTLARSNLYNLENLADLSELPANGARLTVLPMKLAGASGAPARVLAYLDSGCLAVKPPFLLLVIALFVLWIVSRA
ncbi:hypothetical protein LAZ67_3000322 [Cordylochernes scorpioides]|uniref:Cyclase n=1 Tax=Cordylochernes scorpioides TaxID=51811 RepID=A0ABY6K926_9ARAC|nr:hypothetical protein LAZ67_3000322 [Cordylochernes scorpioides]